MLNDIYSFHRQFRFDSLIAFIEKELSPIAKYLYLTGMGGSSLPGDLINDYLFGSHVLHILRDYQLPVQITKEDVVICSSYSGNTEETLSVLDQALEKKIPIVVLTHGGLLKQKAIDLKLPLIEIPECIQPRCATGYFFTAILSILEKIGKIPSQNEALLKLSSFLEERKTAHEKEGRKLAHALKDSVPIIYGPSEFEGTCRFWKIKFNENSKIQSFYNVFPELNHNEMVGYTKLLMKPAIIYLKSKFMHPRIGRRMEVMQTMLQDKMPFHTIEMQGESRLQEMFDSLLIADYASYYLAQAYGFDPAPVEMVESFKKMLG